MLHSQLREINQDKEIISIFPCRIKHTPPCRCQGSHFRFQLGTNFSSGQIAQKTSGSLLVEKAHFRTTGTFYHNPIVKGFIWSPLGRGLHAHVILTWTVPRASTQDPCTLWAHYLDHLKEVHARLHCILWVSLGILPQVPPISFWFSSSHWNRPFEIPLIWWGFHSEPSNASSENYLISLSLWNSLNSILLYFCNFYIINAAITNNKA